MNLIVARLVVLSRWMLVPLLLGLIVALLLLVVFFFIELWSFFVHLPNANGVEVIMGLLSMIDLTLIGSLMVIVIFSGYENFVEKIDLASAAGWPEWMTRVSFSGLKQKLFASMMAISGITLLKALMKLEISVSEAQVKWLAIANVIFVLGYAVLVVADKYNGHADNADGH